MADELQRVLPGRALLGIELCRALLTLMTADGASRLLLTATSLSACLDFLSGMAASSLHQTHAARLCAVFSLLQALAQGEELDEAVVLRLADSCLVPVFAATAAAPFAARVVVCLFDRHDALQGALLEACLARQWPLELRPTFRLLPPGRGLIHQASALLLELLRSPEHCAAVVAALFAPPLRPVLALLLADAAACLGLQPNAAPLLLAASAKCAHHAVADPWALEALGGVVAAVAQVTALPADAGECAACAAETAGPVFRVHCARCGLHYHGACVSVADERAQTLGRAAAEEEEEQQQRAWTCRACRVRQHPLSETAPSFVKVCAFLVSRLL